MDTPKNGDMLLKVFLLGLTIIFVYLYFATKAELNEERMIPLEHRIATEYCLRNKYSKVNKFTECVNNAEANPLKTSIALYYPKEEVESYINSLIN